MESEVVTKSKCSQAQLRASKAYYERNKATVIAKTLERNKKYYATNETFRGKCIENAKKYNKIYKEKIKEMSEFITKLNEMKIPNL